MFQSRRFDNVRKIMSVISVKMSTIDSKLSTALNKFIILPSSVPAPASRRSTLHKSQGNMIIGVLFVYRLAQERYKIFST